MAVYEDFGGNNRLVNTIPVPPTKDQAGAGPIIRRAAQPETRTKMQANETRAIIGTS
jgi:hypothetical protein